MTASNPENCQSNGILSQVRSLNRPGIELRPLLGGGSVSDLGM
ncbi:hypothetical protein [Synechococcus elongatus]|nr:hypothetical protein [Synechococcus elongatus]